MSLPFDPFVFPILPTILARSYQIGDRRTTERRIRSCQQWGHNSHGS